jgi:hypothetical protein
MGRPYVDRRRAVVTMVEVDNGASHQTGTSLHVDVNGEGTAIAQPCGRNVSRSSQNRKSARALLRKQGTVTCIFQKRSSSWPKSMQSAYIVGNSELIWPRDQTETISPMPYRVVAPRSA